MRVRVRERVRERRRERASERESERVSVRVRERVRDAPVHCAMVLHPLVQAGVTGVPRSYETAPP